MEKKLNILFVTVDQMRGECLSILGSDVLTPHLDLLAGDAVLFKNHFAQCVPCAPSRASLLTGMYQRNHRVVANGTPLDSRHTNIALELRKMGYDPKLLGDTDISPDPRDLPEDDPSLYRTYGGLAPGFSVVVDNDKESEYPLGWPEYLKEKNYDVPDNLEELFWPQSDGKPERPQGPSQQPAFYKAEDSDTNFMVNSLIEYLDSPECKSAPWFAHLSILRPHPPFIAPEPYNTMYDPADMPLPARKDDIQDEKDTHPWLAQQIELYEKNVSDNVRPEDDMQLLKAVYYGMISEVDDALGRLFDFLKESGKYDDTLIVFTSDHGEYLGDHWLMGKPGYYDQAFFVPLIIRDPRPEARQMHGTQVDKFTENVDLMPTILDIVGADEIPRQCDGFSLKPILEGKDVQDWRTEAHFEFDFRDLLLEPSVAGNLGIDMDQCSATIIRGKKYKYVHFTALPPLFFDIEADPDELNNLANDPAYTPLVLEYAQKMLSWGQLNQERELTHIRLCSEGPVDRRNAKKDIKNQSSLSPETKTPKPDI